MLADCWLVGCLVFLNSKSILKWLTCLDWLHGWRLPSLLSWSVVGWLVLAKRLTECGWLLVGGWLGALWRQNPDSNDWLVLTDCMAGGSPLCLAGRWLVDWFWQRDWQNVWLIVGGWVAWYFYCKIETKNWLTCLDQLTDCMAGGSPPCLAGRWLVNWYWQRDWQNVVWLLVAGLLGVFEFKIETKMTELSWLIAWLAAPLLA